jgi:hypothetical protein
MRGVRDGYVAAKPGRAGAVPFDACAVRCKKPRNVRIRLSVPSLRRIVDRFSNALAETLREPEIQSRIEAMQITMQIGSPVLLGFIQRATVYGTWGSPWSPSIVGAT